MLYFLYQVIHLYGARGCKAAAMSSTKVFLVEKHSRYGMFFRLKIYGIQKIQSAQYVHSYLLYDTGDLCSRASSM